MNYYHLNELQELTYIYDSIEIPYFNNEIATSSEQSPLKNVLLWIILPLLIAVSLLIVAVRYLFSKWKQMRQSHV